MEMIRATSRKLKPRRIILNPSWKELENVLLSVQFIVLSDMDRSSGQLIGIMESTLISSFPARKIIHYT